MSMQIVKLIQGTPEWHAHRAKHFNASDAPAMMGCSSHKSRSDLIKELATGIVPEVDAATQRRFDDGHRFEALARPLAEKIIDDELSPCVGVNGKYSASFDGLTFMHDVGFEHKTLNNELREAMFEGCDGEDLPPSYRVQMEQQAMVSGCKRILFMASVWKRIDFDLPENDPDAWELVEERHCWYEPDAELRAQIIAGWEQIEKDVSAYDPADARPAQAVAAPVESLPAVVIQVNGALTIGGNLDAFGDALRGFISNMVPIPKTDQEFADAESECKALKKAEDALDAGEDAALASISVVEQMRRLKADLKNLARTTRLAREKLVAAEKEKRRTAIVTNAQESLDMHVQALNKRLGSNWIARVMGGFGEVIKGKKSLANMDDAVAVALTNAKHEASQLADRLEANRKHLVQDDADWIALFADFSSVGTKAAEDFQALAALRIGNHKQAEAQRMEAERQRIRAEVEAKAQREAKERAEAEAAENARKLEEDRARIRAEEQAIALQQTQAAEAERQRVAEESQKPNAQMVPGDAGTATQTEAANAGYERAAESNSIDSHTHRGNDAISSEATLKLGQVNTMLKAAGLGQISAETLDVNGIAYTKERGSVLVKEIDVHRLMLKMAMGLRKLADDMLQTKAAD